MSDIASLAVGLHLNAANFKSQLMGAYNYAENQSKRFNRNAQGDAKKIDDAYRKVGVSISSLTSRIAGLAGAGLSIGTIITTARQYGQALSDLRSVTGATNAQIKELSLAAQSMGMEMAYGARDVVDAMKDMAAANPSLMQTSNGLQEATKSALLLSTATGSSLSDAAQTLGLSLNQFGASVGQADRYINILAGTVKTGLSGLNDTADAIKSSGIIASKSGVSFEQLNAAIHILAENGIKGGQAGITLRNIILNLEKATDKNLRPSVVGLDKALSNLAGKHLSTAQAAKLFGARNLDTVSILVDGRIKLLEYTAALTGTKTAEEEAASRVNNLNGDLAGLSSSFDWMINKIGESSDGILRSGVQVATAAIKGLAENFTVASNIALYTFIPVLSSKLTTALSTSTSGIRENISLWNQNRVAVISKARADVESAQKTLASTAAVLRRNDADFAHYRQMEKMAKSYGLNVSYQSQFNRLIREETEQTRLATQAKARLAAANQQLSISARATSAAVSIGRGALSVIGGPLGAAMLAATAIYEFNQSNKVARQSALDLKDAIVQTTEELLRMSQAKIAVKVDDYQEQLEGINKERDKVKNELTRYSDTRINLAKSREDGALSFLFPSKNSLQKEKNKLLGQLEDLNSAAERTQQNLINARIAASGKSFAIDTFLPPEPIGHTGSTGDYNNDPPRTGDGDAGKRDKEKLDQFRQLRQQIEEAHATSLGRINLQEQESNRQLQEVAKKYGASSTELQHALLMNTENYQKQRLDLAAQYSPLKETLLKEQEGSRELESLFKANLLTEKEYQTARVTLARDTAKGLLQAQADAISAPKLDIAGEVDPLVALRNQLTQRQSLLQAYYTSNTLSKDQYEMLMQKAAKESADAQYQTSLELYRSQGEFQSMAVGLFETVHERSTDFLMSMLTRTQSFKENMLGLFSSLTQAVIKNLIDMAAQAFVTSSIMQTIMGVVGIGSSIVGGVVSGADGASTGTAIQNAGNNFDFQIPGYAKGGVFDSPSLSVYSNQVHDTPHFFAFAKGAGVFGEAGPEAIMPLTRAGDGSLGVRAVGGGQNAIATEGPKVWITISNNKTSTDSSSGFEEFGQQIGSFVERKYRELQVKDMRPGGAIWNAVKGQR